MAEIASAVLTATQIIYAFVQANVQAYKDIGTLGEDVKIIEATVKRIEESRKNKPIPANALKPIQRLLEDAEKHLAVLDSKKNC